MSRAEYLEQKGYSAYILSETDSDIASELFPFHSDGNLNKAELDIVLIAGIKQEKDKIAFTKEAKTYPLFLTDRCPQCYSEEMNIYKINDLGYFCHCEQCDVSGSTRDYRSFLDKLEEAIWNQE